MLAHSSCSSPPKALSMCLRSFRRHGFGDGTGRRPVDVAQIEKAMIVGVKVKEALARSLA
jgi:hypothetical protein